MQGMHASQVRTTGRGTPRTFAGAAGAAAPGADAVAPGADASGSGANRRGFTLTELLIVIAIIGVLASLITAAAINAMRRAREARIQLEINQVSQALDTFNTDLNSYPPNAMNDGSPVMFNRVNSAFERTIKGAFSRIDPQELAVFRALAGDPATGAVITRTNVTNGMRGDEALYFWLGGFSGDPKYPLSGDGGPSYIRGDIEVFENRQPRYGFNIGNLGPRNEEDELDYDNVRFVEYTINMNGTTQNRRLNLWSYYPEGSARPLVYFDASRHKPVDYLAPTIDPNEDAWVYPLITRRQGAPSGATDPRLFTYANKGKFQILHSGLDDSWGTTYIGGASLPPMFLADVNDWLVFPDGPFLDSVADTLTNFTSGALEDAQEE